VTVADILISSVKVLDLVCNAPFLQRSLMVLVGVSALETTSIHLVEPDVKVNNRYYREVLLMQKLVPDIRHLSEQDSAPAHRACETVDLLTRETPETSVFPRFSCQTAQMDYKVRSVLQKVYKRGSKDVDELHSRILTAWDELDQHAIDMAARQWHTCLRARVTAKGGHFEYELSH